MSLFERWHARRTAWHRHTRRLREVLDRRIALNRWYPHVPIALLMIPLGLLLSDAAARSALGVGIHSVELADLEAQASELQHRPILELALGFSLIAVSIGIAFRSRLAWLWSLGILASGASLRFPPERVELPIAFYLLGVIVLLVVHRRSFGQRGVVSSVGFAIVALVTFFVWATLGILRMGNDFVPPIHDLPTALYFVVVTVSSVGYGDIVAHTPAARLFVVATIAIGITVAATALGTVLSPLIVNRMRDVLGGRANVDRTQHYVIVGKSPLARSAALELEQRKQQVTLIVDKATDEEFFAERDVIVGDPADLSVLRTAGALDAKGVLALSTDDATNCFVVLGVNELDATIPTVAALNDSANQSRLRRCQPSMVLSLQALGGRLLASALTGEHVDLDMLTRVLEVHGTEPAPPPGP
jgi:voltage-gated potassium channel